MEYVYLVDYSFSCDVVFDDGYSSSGEELEKNTVQCFKHEEDAIIFAKKLAEDLVESSTRRLELKKPTPFEEVDISNHAKTFKLSRFLDRDVSCEKVFMLHRSYKKRFRDYNDADSAYLYSESIIVRRYFLFGSSACSYEAMPITQYFLD